MSKLAIQDYPLIILPSLAKKLGVVEAVILQQVHYWLNNKSNKNFIQEKKWVYNTYAQWGEQLPFWSTVTIRRAIKSLEKNNLLISANFNKDAFSKTKWYTINYAKLSKIDNSLTPPEMHLEETIKTTEQNEQSISSKRSSHLIKMSTSYISNTETTTETTNSLSKSLKNSKPHQGENVMLDTWNKIIQKDRSFVLLTEQRIRLLDKILKEFFDNKITLWEEFCHKVTQSSFLRGEVTKFRITLDWVLKPNNLIKVLEGNYHNRDEITLIAPIAIEQEQDILHTINELNAPEIWKNILTTMLKTKGVATFCAWFRKNQFVKFENGVLEIKSCSAFVASWLRDRYFDDILRAGRAVSQDLEDLRFVY